MQSLQLSLPIESWGVWQNTGSIANQGSFCVQSFYWGSVMLTWLATLVTWPPALQKSG
jgi:hypothetical protein